MSSYIWLDCRSDDTPELLALRLKHMVAMGRPMVVLCIGTPAIPGDSLGPAVGSLLSHDKSLHVYGTMEAPVHALNLKATLKDIRRQFRKPMIIVVDAALGNEYQNGFLAIKKGALRPGSGLGKRLPSIGDIQITGVFCSLYGHGVMEQMQRYSWCIANGLAAFYE